MECSNYKGGCAVCVSRCLKELAWAIDKWSQVYLLLKKVIPLRIQVQYCFKLGSP